MSKEYKPHMFFYSSSIKVHRWSTFSDLYFSQTLIAYFSSNSDVRLRRFLLVFVFFSNGSLSGISRSRGDVIMIHKHARRLIQMTHWIEFIKIVENRESRIRKSLTKRLSLSEYTFLKYARRPRSNNVKMKWVVERKSIKF